MKKTLTFEEIRTKIATYTMVTTASLIGVLGMSAYLVYQANARDRLELVVLDSDKFDTPAILKRVRADSNEVTSDRWVRGFTRQYVKNHFIQPFDSNETAKTALAWLHAHSGGAGKNRAESFLDDLDKYNDIRKNKFTSFWVANDPAAVKIRKAGNDARFLVELLGTFGTREDGKEALYNAVLRLDIASERVTGEPNKFGVINTSGLRVENIEVEYTEDATKGNEKTKHNLLKAFGEKK